MQEDNKDDPEYLIKLNKTAVFTLLAAVDKYIEVWPGGHPDEQTNLQTMQHYLRAVALEFQFEQ